MSLVMETYSATTVPSRWRVACRDKHSQTSSVGVVSVPVVMQTLVLQTIVKVVHLNRSAASVACNH